ncbi:MAG TPA: metallopeptidase family protein [Gemmatimonadales bacterium]|nr:metallopeptidase family protein [Gemmatimonadales bacterium]
MRADAFEAMVRRMCADVPREYFDGVTEVTVSPRALPHPIRAEIYTLGECIPLPLEGEGPEAIQSRVVLYHGSFRALAELDPDFDWEGEAWETLTHELRHHVEWRARRDDLEAFDRAAEENFKRLDGEPFDPLFFLDGDAPVPGVHQVDDDWFIDHLVRSVPSEVRFIWHGRHYAAAVPAGATLPAYLVVDGVSEPPPGDLVLVLRRRPRVLDLFRTVTVFQDAVTAIEVEEALR